jgi:hypothetical protein
MRKLLLRLTVFAALVWALGQISFLVLLTGIGLSLALVAVMHILATPAHRDA